MIEISLVEAHHLWRLFVQLGFGVGSLRPRFHFSALALVLVLPLALETLSLTYISSDL